jgi:branched-chain amino acid transport system ATP-binding protein
VRMVARLGELKRELSILPLEHEMQGVFALAGRIAVLVHGRIIASAGPEEIRADPRVRTACLGEQEAVQAHG